MLKALYKQGSLVLGYVHVYSYSSRQVPWSLARNCQLRGIKIHRLACWDSVGNSPVPKDLDIDCWLLSNRFSPVCSKVRPLNTFFSWKEIHSMFFILRLFSFCFSHHHNIPFFYKMITIIDEFFFFFFLKPLLGKRKTGKFYVNFFPLFLIKYYYFVKFKGSDLYPYNLDGNPRHQIHSFESHTLTEFWHSKVTVKSAL